jgi:RTX calcium-binding nonapeptide repeat (4 copies)
MGTWSPGPGATNGPDVFVGDISNEVALGLGGDDHLNGGGGSDTLEGGAGNDWIEGGVVSRGGDGDDWIYMTPRSPGYFAEGGAGTDRLIVPATDYLSDYPGGVFDANAGSLKVNGVAYLTFPDLNHFLSSAAAKPTR